MREVGADHSRRVYLLGGFCIERDGEEIPVSAWKGRNTARTLVKLLALEPAHRLHREEVLELLWPNVSLGSALNRFTKALHYARRALENGPAGRAPFVALLLRDDVISLATDHIWVDVDAFEQQARAALLSGQIDACQEAIALYRGELLPEDRFKPWTLVRRDTLNGLYLEVLLRLAGLLEERGQYDEAIELLQRALGLDPWREEAHRSLMRLYALSGRRHQALRQYRLLAEALEKELSIEPAPETEALYRAILEGTLGPPIPPAPLEVTPFPLPPGIRRHPPQAEVLHPEALDLLRTDLAAVERGEGRVVLLTGEAGVGKTWLMRHLAHEAHARGALVLGGSSYALESRMPYAPLIEALENYAVALPLWEREALATQYPILARLIPSLTLSAPLDQPQESDEVVHGRLLARFAALLAGLAARQTVLLIVGDVHAADDATLHVLQHLARTAVNHRLLIIAMYRSEDARGRLDAGTFELRADRHIALSRLSPAESERFLRSLLPDGPPSARFVQRVFALSCGNPLMIAELVQSMREDGTVRLVDGEWQIQDDAVWRVPPRIADLVVARTNRLDELTRRVLTLAAVAGRETSFPLLRSLVLMEEALLVDALDRALDAGFLEERGELYIFSQPLVRQAIYERLSGLRRRTLHGEVAAEIERESPQEVDALAYHYARSDTPEKAIPYLERAGDRARALHANQDARHHYRALLDHLAEDGPARARVEEKLGYVQTVLAEYADALEALDRAFRLYEAAEERESVARVLAQIGRVHFLRQTPEPGSERIEAFLRDEGEGLRPAILVELHAVLAALLWRAGRYSEQLQRAEEAVALAHDAQAEVPDRVVVEAEIWWGIGLCALGRSQEGIGALEAAIPRAEEADDLLNLSRALNTLAAAYWEQGDLVRERDYIERGLAAAERLGDPVRIAFMLYRRGWGAWVAGNWEEARIDMEAARALDLQTGPTWVTASILYGLGALTFSEGEYDEAERLLDESIRVAGAGSDARILWAARSYLARIDIARGRFDDAVARLEDAMRYPGMDAADMAALLTIQAAAYLMLWREDEAESYIWRALDSLHDQETHPVMVDVRMILGMVEMRRGRRDTARIVLEQALTGARALINPYLEARVLFSLGVLYCKLGEAVSARTVLDGAQSIFQRLGARQDLERAQEWLAGIS